MHALSRPDVAEAIAASVSTHLGRPWTAGALVDLGDRASHPCAILRGEGLDVFAKLSTAVDGAEQFDAEQRGLLHVQRHAGVLVPSPIGAGIVTAGDCAVLVLEALPEIAPAERGPAEWRVIGQALAQLHGVTGPSFGLDGPDAFDGFLGPLRQPNGPVAGGWASFLHERRIEPFRAAARASSHLPPALDRRLDHLVARLDSVAGPEPVPSLLHGDAQQHNFVSTPGGAALIDVSPYFGHPEVDLAMLGIFRPVPDDVLDGYRDVRPIAADATARIELWRLPAYLAVIAADGANPFGRSFVPRLAAALTLSGA
ncbi:MAG: fructosamine kinase family protein [Ilumatobacteraceae bacterium]